MQQAFRDFKYSMALKTGLLSAVMVLAAVSLSYSQATISGTVTDQNGEPVSAANILFPDINRGTATNMEGRYTITDIPEGTYTFRVTFVGFQEYEDEITVEEGENLIKDVTLQPGAVNLEELVVTGYGATQRQNITSSISSVDSETIQESPVQNADKMLQGKATGVLISQNSGDPGAAMRIRIRGTSSITANKSPLFIVDGVPLNPGGGAALGVGGQQANPLSSLSTNDIESMEVLKGASATAIYGSRGSNGVVLITTREGETGNTQIDVSYSHGISETINTRDMLNSEGHIKMYVDAMYADFNNISPDFAGAIPNPYENWGTYQERYITLRNELAQHDLSFADYGLPAIDTYGANPSEAPTTDWMGAVFRPGSSDNFSTTISGGSEDTQFLVSGSYNNEKGTMIGSAFKRLNGRLNINHEFNDRFNIDGKISLARTINNRIENDNNISGVLSTATLASPTRPIYNEDGTYNQETGTFANPVAESENKNEGQRTRFIGSVNSEYEIADNLFITGSGSIDHHVLKEDGYFPRFTNQGNPAGAAVASAGFNQTWQVEGGLSYRNVINETHNIQALAVASFQESSFEQTVAEGTGFPSDAFTTIESASTTEGTSFATSSGLASYIANSNYVYDERYILSLTARLDASSRFSEDNRYAFFPAIGVGWRISNEKFMQDIDLISELKLRASAGISGNQGIGDFSYQALYTGSTYSGTTALTPSQIPNPNLKWEETTQIDAGIDIGLLENRFSATLNVYYKDTQDLLLFRPIPHTTGFTSINSNVGGMVNKGIEFSITTNNLQHENFQWSTTLNISANRNKVTSLYQDQPINAEDSPNSIRVGEPLGVFYAYKTNGIWNSQQELDEYLAEDPNHDVGSARPGDVRFIDINGDGSITGDDQTVIGSPNPDLFGGLRNKLSYKGFQLNTFIQFNYGGLIFNSTRTFAEHYGAAYTATTSALKRWDPDNMDTGVYRASWLDRNNNVRDSDLFLEDRSYLRLEEVTLSYNFNRSALDDYGIRSLRIFASAYNLMTFTNYSGLDPEVNTLPGSDFVTSVDFLTYPQSRSVSIGINLGL